MKELWLFTTRFPYGMREAFLENELQVLSERFERVRIFPEHPEGPLRRVPPNVTVELPVRDPFAPASKREMLAAWSVVLKLIGALLRDAPSMGVLSDQWPTLRSRMAQFIHRAAVLRRIIMPSYDPGKVLVYAYWTHDWATVLGVIREALPSLRFISRAHGFDMFEEQNENGWIPFRSFQLRHVSRIFCASQNGLQHMQERWPQHKGLFELAQLGTTDHGAGPFEPQGQLTVVSCSFLIPRKRVHRLIEALALVDQPVRWIHFGGGEEEGAIREAANRLPVNIQVELRGMTRNEDLIAWYKANSVDVFVHLSHLEGGVAVAVQEATSFGIPVIAADSGGVRELVGPRTGILLGNDPTPVEVAAYIAKVRTGHMGTRTFREGVREEWRRKFEARTVFNGFVDRLLG